MTAAAARRSPSTNRIRIELTFGALTMRELADRLGLPTTKPLHPYISQMVNRTHEVVRLPGPPKRLQLRKQRTALSEVWR